MRMSEFFLDPPLVTLDTHLLEVTKHDFHVLLKTLAILHLLKVIKCHIPLLFPQASAGREIFLYLHRGETT